MNLSLLIPSRNNLDFLKLAYSSIRKNQGNHHVEILVLDDKSDKDNTWEWCLKTMQVDPNFKAFKNNRNERLGISGGFKFLSQQATQDVIGHFHADMFMVEGTLDAIEWYLFSPVDNNLPVKENKNVICLTRIEPPIYSKPGLYPEKIIWKDAPIEIEDWDEHKFLDFLPEAKKLWNGKRTEGYFVPFFMFTKEYLKLGGVDNINYKFQAREDSDFAFRLVLAGYETIQIPTFVFHFASRGNRRAKDNSGTWQDSPEWQQIEQKSIRNFIRKWQTIEMHDPELKPLKPKVYNIGFILQNPTLQHLYDLEPWCQRMVCPSVDNQLIDNYIRLEQPNTPFDLKEKLEYGGCETEIIVQIDAQRFNTEDFKIITNLSQIITEDGEVGEFEIGNLKITIKEMNTCEHELIVCQNEPINLED